MNIDERKYPIGEFSYTGDEDETLFDQHLEDIASLPDRIREMIADCSDHELSGSYREGAWNVVQIIRHMIDSHMNAIMRIKLALTESEPEIRPYLQNECVMVEENWNIPLELDLNLLESIHEKLSLMLSELTKDQLDRTYLHPEAGIFSIRKAAALYAWHSNHHLAHIDIITQKAKS